MFLTAVKLIATLLLLLIWWISMSFTGTLATMPSNYAIALALIAVVASSAAVLALLKLTWKKELAKCEEALEILD